MTLPPLVLVSDAARLGEERFLAALAAARAGGLRWVQVREPSWSDEEARRLLEAVLHGAPAGSITVVNRRLELALELGLDGVHVGGGRIDDVRAARGRLGRGRLVGYSAHSRAEVLAAAAAGADYAFFSPVHAPLSKAHSLPPAGPEALRAAAAGAGIPVYALGGMTPERAPAARDAGAAGAAAIGAILDAPDPAAAVRGFLAVWEGRAPAR